MRKPHRQNGNIRLVLGAAVLLLLALACSPAEVEVVEKGPVVVASKIDTEGALLGSMIVQILQNDGFAVTDRTQFGPTDVIRRAIINDEIDLYPEYTGNGAFFFGDGPRDVWNDATAGYEAVRELDREANDIVWLQPAPANNTWAIAVREDLAEAEGLSTLEDLARYMNDGGQVRLAGSEEFAARDDALPAFEAAYGFEFTSDRLLLLSGGDTAVTAQAAARQTDGVNLAMAYGTDGQLSALGLRVLDDTLGVQPVYEPAPIIRAAVLEEYSEIEGLLAPVFEGLTLEVLQGLNAAIQVEGRDASEVAREYLNEHGFLN
ncbi:MAG: ABC transporter substrate-binding protein [Spirochaetaceae bacterium]|nr:MAG: ABC transporter substrate-binding protein [Spirochaetaceae bacterium]